MNDDSNDVALTPVLQEFWDDIQSAFETISGLGLEMYAPGWPDPINETTLRSSFMEWARTSPWANLTPAGAKE